jgi:hypothetical protein
MKQQPARWDGFQCLTCGYDLTGLDTDTCSECGVAIEAANYEKLEALRESVPPHCISTLGVCLVLGYPFLVEALMSGGEILLDPRLCLLLALPIAQWGPATLHLLCAGVNRHRAWSLIWMSTSGWLLWLAPFALLITDASNGSPLFAAMISSLGLIVWGSRAQIKARSLGLTLWAGEGRVFLVLVAVPYLLYLAVAVSALVSGVIPLS